jgi:hypothetical protein
MRPEDLTAEIHDLDHVPNQRSGQDRLEKQARLIRLKAQLVGRSSSDLAARLENIDTTTRDCLQADVRAAKLEVPADGDSPDRAFERAVSTIEGLVTTHH